MHRLGEYVVSVVATACICGIALSLMPKSSARELVRMLCGLLLAMTALGPVTRINFEALLEQHLPFSEDAAQTAALGEAYSQKALRDIIKQKTEAYILDKAKALGASVTAEVILSAGDIPVPLSVRLSGNLSPLAKKRLSEDIRQELGIAKENQIWSQ